MPTSPSELTTLATTEPRNVLQIESAQGKSGLFTRELGYALRQSCKIVELYLSCAVSRAALSAVASIELLARLSSNSLVGPGILRSFASAISLEAVFVPCGLLARDTGAILDAPQLKELNVQCSAISRKVVRKMATHPNLESIDLEGTALDDEMAQDLAFSRTIKTLHLGATLVTRRGLQFLAEMPRLSSLDLWECRLSDSDLEVLREMPQLQSVTLGSAEGHYNGNKIFHILENLPNLNWLWLDGVVLPEELQQELKNRVEYCRIDPPVVSR